MFTENTLAKDLYSIELLKSNTKVIYVETITNPLIEVAPLEKIVAFAKENGLISMIDNTPILTFAPLSDRNHQSIEIIQLLSKTLKNKKASKILSRPFGIYRKIF